MRSKYISAGSGAKEVAEPPKRNVKQPAKMAAKEVVPGMRFGRWLVISEVSSLYCLCQCDCGTKKPVYVYSLSRRKSKGCGCICKLHGKSKTSEHITWMAMFDRCYNPKHANYEDYGGRGIAVSERWHNFVNFFNDMGKRPAGLQLDRIDNDGPYSKENCRWATVREQANNRRNTIFVTYQGQSITIRKLAELSGVNYSLLQLRLRRGWTPELAAHTPKQKYANKQ